MTYDVTYLILTLAPAKQKYCNVANCAWFKVHHLVFASWGSLTKNKMAAISAAREAWVTECAKMWVRSENSESANLRISLISKSGCLSMMVFEQSDSCVCPGGEDCPLDVSCRASGKGEIMVLHSLWIHLGVLYTIKLCYSESGHNPWNLQVFQPVYYAPCTWTNLCIASDQLRCGITLWISLFFFLFGARIMFESLKAVIFKIKPALIFYRSVYREMIKYEAYTKRFTDRP